MAVALCAFAVTASSALAAAPEFFHCAANASGKYSTKAKCEAAVLGGTGFEKQAVAAGEKVKFTDKSGVQELRSAAHETITCMASTSKGEIEGPKKVVNVIVKFTKCTQGTAKVKCHSVVVTNKKEEKEGTAGANEEEIITNTLEGELGFGTGTKTVVEDLKPTLPSERFVSLKCGTLSVAVTGSVIGEVVPVEKLQTTGTLVFAANAGNTNQKFIEYENSGGTNVNDHLTAFVENAWLVGIDEITFVEAIEVT